MSAAANGIQMWSPALGHVNKTAAISTSSQTRDTSSKEATPMPGGTSKTVAAQPKTGISVPDSRLAEESFAIHMRYGSECMDENPITGKPGDFHLSSTGRKDKLVVPAGGKPVSLSLNTKTPPDSNNPLSKDVKSDKGKVTPGKPRRRKSKGGTTTPT
jgi:mediator of RNA polymerase II transcription subunit 6